MGYRRLFIMRKDLHMSPGKLAAQVSHCAEAYWTRWLSRNMIRNGLFEKYIVHGSIPDGIVEQYIDGSFVKTVCEAKNKKHLLKAKDIAASLGLIEDEDYGLIWDKCLTELIPEEDNGTTLTGIWFKPLPDYTSLVISKKYQLYK